MKITAIHLKNFRGFRDTRLELKPLTVLLGPNSAGKSSFGQALAALKHVNWLYAGTPQASLTPPENDDVNDWPVDLGITTDLRTHGATGAIRIGLQTRTGLVELGFGGLTHTEDLLLSSISHPRGEQSSAASIPANATIMELSPGQASGVVPVEGTFSNTATAIELKRKEQIWREDTDDAVVILSGLILKAVSHQTGTSKILSGAARDDLTSFLEDLTYLRANRKRPSRGYKQSAGRRAQPIGYSGEYAPSILHEKGEHEVEFLFPPAIPQSIEEAQKESLIWGTKRTSLRNALQEWLSKIEMADNVETIVPPLNKDHVMLRVAPKDCGQHDITEVGFGVSQVIPVLVAGLLQPKDSLFIVDLPEAHLHPVPQGAIADFFCSMALSGRSVLVETHSEMFFHRLRLRAAMNPTLMENIAVYCIDQPSGEGCNDPRLMGLRFEDELRWPEGFLHEALEIELQINAVREANRINANDSTSA